GQFQLYDPRTMHPLHEVSCSPWVAILSRSRSRASSLPCARRPRERRSRAVPAELQAPDRTHRLAIARAPPATTNRIAPEAAPPIPQARCRQPATWRDVPRSQTLLRVRRRIASIARAPATRAGDGNGYLDAELRFLTAFA